ncbi:hypothetical protein OnM2_052036 [Erysiphe neolycopersici]|uniref:BHLH domain-containing protein n=1 Tax=Erysiphe neolycopersici TaxID=212602 RepID=A0A420HS41_9PEZI|nr:hypothetical protein OnM2_052036 [Erysiphe neolycopersici]
MSIEEIREQSDACNEKIRALKSKTDKMTADKESARVEIVTLEKQVGNFSQQLASAKHLLEKKQTLAASIEELRDSNNQQRSVIDGANTEFESLEPQVAKAKAHHEDVQRRGQAKEKDVQSDKDKLNSTVNRFKLIEDAINTYIENDGPGKIEACERSIKLLKKELDHNEKEVAQLTKKSNDLKTQLADGNNTKRSIQDNIRFRKSVKDLKVVSEDIAELETHNAAEDYERYRREAAAADKRVAKLTSERGPIIGSMHAKDEDLGKIMAEWEIDYKDAAASYRKAHVEVETTKAAIEDMQKCSKALDNAIMQFYSVKMEEINSIAAELWQKTPLPYGDPIQSPFVSKFNHEQFRHMAPQHNFGSSLHSGSYTGSPIAGSSMHNGLADGGFPKAQRPRLNASLGRKSSTRSPLTPKTTSTMAGLHIGSAENSNFAQPIWTHSAHRHQKTLSGQWDQTPSSLASYPGSDFSPIQGVHPNPQISDILLKGASMPTKLNNGHSIGSAPALQSQEMKRRRRRESHNLVERRRRDNINERIQELSHLVPMHRLEDEKVRKALQNNSPLSPSLVGLSVPPGASPPQATSGLAGPGARRATAGNITTGIPIEKKDKGPNKGDILNGAVSWTRDLMWMLHTKLQQQEELAELIHSLGGTFPFQQTEDEKRMHAELMDAMVKNDGSKFEYSRGPNSGLRVPKHTDVRGEPVDRMGNGGQLDNSLSPDNLSTGEAGMGGAGQYWSAHNSGGSGPGSSQSSNKMPFDTTSLRDFVHRASVLSRTLADLIRKADGLSQSPETSPHRESSPAFTRVFTDPSVSPPKNLLRSHSNNSILSGSIDGSLTRSLGQRMHMMTVV